MECMRVEGEGLKWAIWTHGREERLPRTKFEEGESFIQVENSTHSQHTIFVPRLSIVINFKLTLDKRITF